MGCQSRTTAVWDEARWRRTTIVYETEKTSAPSINDEPEITPQITSSIDQNGETEGEYYIGNKNSMKFHNPNTGHKRSKKLDKLCWPSLLSTPSLTGP